MLLVTAANGNQGQFLIPRLLASGMPFRACVQSEQSAAALRARGVEEIFVGDLSDAATVDRALEGISIVYCVGPACHPKEREMGFLMVDAASKAGVRHFIFSSVLHAIVTELVQHEIKRDIEEYLVGSGLEYTILQPTNYMLPLKLKPVFADNIFHFSWDFDRLQSMVDLGDLAELVLLIAQDPERHAAATYELASEGRYSAHDLRAIIAKVTGREIALEKITPEVYLKAVFGDYESAEFQHQIGVHRAITAYYSAHDFIGNANVLRMLLGREPTSFETFVRREMQTATASA